MLFVGAKINAQICANATTTGLDTTFSWYEHDGEAFVSFIPTDSITVVWASLTSTSLPDNYFLYTGTCSGLAVVDSGNFTANEDGLLYLKFLNLKVGKTYHISFASDPGVGFTLDGIIQSFSIQNPNTCNTTPCNLVQNPGFETPESNRNSLNPVGNGLPGGNARIAFINQACGWDFPSLASS